MGVEHLEGWHCILVIHFNSEPGVGREDRFNTAMMEKLSPEIREKIQKENKEWIAELLTSQPCAIESFTMYKVGDHFKVKEEG